MRLADAMTTDELDALVHRMSADELLVLVLQAEHLVDAATDELRRRRIAAGHRTCPACGIMPAEAGDRYCDECGSATDRSAWAGPALRVVRDTP